MKVVLLNRQIHCLVLLSNLIIIGRSTLVQQRHMKWFLSICLSVLCLPLLPSVCSSLIFLKIGSVLFSDVVQDDSWLWSLVTEESKFLKKELADQTKSGARWGFSTLSWVWIFQHFHWHTRNLDIFSNLMLLNVQSNLLAFT